MARTLSIHFPDGESQFRFTDRIFSPGDKIDRDGVPWIVTSIGESNRNAKRASITVRRADLSQSSRNGHFAQFQAPAHPAFASLTRG